MEPEQNRRSYDKMGERLAIVELGLCSLDRDILEHKVMTERMCKTLDEIRIEIGVAKGFIKAITISSCTFGLVVGVLYTVQWLKVPF